MHLLERQEQLDVLNRCLQEAHRACGKLVLIAGEAGLGKSSLVEQFVWEHQHDVRALWGACDALSTPRALAPVHEIAAQICGAAGTARDDEPRNWLFRLVLDNLSQQQRVCVVVLEDLHWADFATLDFVRFIGRRIQRTNAVFIATYRDELSANDPVRFALGELTGDHVIRLRLAPLSLTAVEGLARESGRDAATLHQATGGNPFFVREVLASPGEPVPATVRDAVLARLMRCSAGTRELAKLVAITPGRCEIWLIESVLGASGNAVDEAVILGLLEAQTDAVSFRHELARLAVLSSIPPHRLRAMHAQVLERFVEHGADAAQLVHHAALAENGPAVLEYAPVAAEKASRLGAHREATVHLSLALRYGPTLTQALRADFLERHAQESALANQTPEAIASAMAAVVSWRELGDVQSESRVLCLLSQEYRTVGNTRGADECAAVAISLLEGLPRSAGLAMAYGARSLLAVNRGRNWEALEFGKRALKLAREVGDCVAESYALCHIGGALLGTGDHAGYEPLEQSLALALNHGWDDHAARAYRTLQFYAGMNHDFARADQAFHEGVEYCEERGIFSHSAYLRAYFTVCELDRGRWTDAAGAATELMRSFEVFGVTQRVTVMATLAVVRLRRGDPGIDELLDPALALALPTGEASRIARVTAARAEQAWYSGRPADVAHETSIGLSHLSGDTTPWLNGELLFWQSRVQTIGTDVGAIAEPWRLMLAEEWRTAAAAWKRIGMPYEQALALAQGNEEDMRDALAIFDRLGAAPMAAIVRRRLRAEGIRDVPRGAQARTRNNPRGLTGRELKVLSLLTSGQRNADIARQLFVSDKTVDHHVSAILAKLGVRSRGEAAAAANRLGLLATGAGESTPKI